MKKLQTAAAIGLILAIVMGNFSAFRTHLQELHSNVLRLHILANSDSQEDQALKLRVRDALLAESAALFGNCADAEEAEERAREAEEQLRKIAEAVVREAGETCGVTVSVGRERYPRRGQRSLLPSIPGGRRLLRRLSAR